MQQTDAADVDALAADGEIVAAGIRVAVGDGVDYLSHGDAVGEQLVGIDLGLILACGAAESGDVDDAGNLFDFTKEQPVLRGLEFVQRVSRTSELVTIDFADGRFGRKLWLEVIGQRNLLQAVHRFLAIDEIVAAEGEIHLYIAQAEDADGADLIEFRGPV